MSTHLQLANSTTMAILCGITILIVLLQPVIFMIVAFKRGKELKHDRPGNEGSRTKQRDLLYYPVTPDHRELPCSWFRPWAVISPWLRLSVVGSAAYETMVANMAAEALGLESITVPDIPADTFVFILFVVTIGILGGNIFNVFFLKAYDKKVESIKNSNAKLVPIITTAMFLGLYGTMQLRISQISRTSRRLQRSCCRYHIDLRKQVCGEPQEVERVRIPAQHDRWNARCMCSESAYLGGKTI